MNLMKIDVAHVAKLANLKLSAGEKDIFGKQLASILDYVNQLESVNVKNIQATSQITGLENVTRPDNDTRPSLSQDEVLSNSERTHNGFLQVKAILEND